MQNLRTNFQHQNVASYSFIKENISLSDKNWFGTGGPAKFFAEPTNNQELIEAYSFAKEHGLALFTLGSGANILISDEGFNGLVIRSHLKKILIIDENSEYALVRAEAGADFHQLITFCLKNQFVGLEEFSGIPGTVGGSVFINIHYFEYLLSSFIERAEILDLTTLEIHNVQPAWFNFGYNQSKLQEQNHLLVSATFKLKKATQLEAAHAQGRHEEIIRHRQKRYPLKGTCGSFFRNFHEDEVSMRTAEGHKLIFIGYYLDTLGIKGSLCVGDAIVSHQHANMIVNRGRATTSDIITLARLMQEKVAERYNILPQPECQLIGFNHYPLLEL